MNQMEQNPHIMLGPGLRNVCDKIINELNTIVLKMSESKREPNEKRREFRPLIKSNFYPYLSHIRKIFKSFDKINSDQITINTLNRFYYSFGEIINQLDFLNRLSDIYIFPKFDLDNSLDLIFNGCTNNIRQELIKANLFTLIPSRNLYDNNDVGFLINNDLNNEDYNKEENNNNLSNNNYNVLLDKENPITKSIIERLNKKFDEFNNYIISNKKDFDQNNFKLFLDDNICVQIYDNFLIKFIVVQEKINNMKYYILPIEISYNNEIINLNDKEEIFKDKNKCLSKDDLQYYINKFKPKPIVNIGKKKKKIEINVEIEKLTNEDFIEKCLLFKEYTKELFNQKYEKLKQDIINFTKKYDMPITIEDNINTNMDLDNNNDNINNDINELTIYYNFIVSIKQKNEFYFKLIYNKNYPTIIKMIFFHNRVIKNNNQNNNYELPPNYIEPVEKIILFDIKEIKNQIKKCYDDYKKILIIWIFKKLKYLYLIFFDCGFQFHEYSIYFGFKSSRAQNSISKKIFSFYINDLGKISYNDLFSSKLFYDNFKEINSIIINFLKSIDNEDEQEIYFNKFNNYINKLITERIFIFPGTRTKLIELDDITKVMVLHFYNSYYTDKNISSYFDIRCQINKIIGSNNNPINCFIMNEIKLICKDNKNENKKIILNCFDKNNQHLLRKIEFNSYYNHYLCKLINDLNNKYEFFMLYASDILKLSENPESVFEFNRSIEVTNINNFKNKEEEWYELSIEKNNMNLFKKEYMDNLLKYFYKIKFSKENNVFQFYLKPDVFKKKYSSILKFPIENYSTMFQYYIFGYDYKEDFITIIILSKLKIGYLNIIQMVFETFIPRIISYMNNIFKLIDNLSKGAQHPIMTACPLFLTLQINYCDEFRNINFKKHINFKITEKEPYYTAEGNYTNVFNIFIKDFGNEIIACNNNDYNNNTFFINKSKYFYLGYSIYNLFLNEFGFKFSLLLYPYNHFKENNENIYFLNKDFNVLELISLNNILLTVQIRNDNSLFLEFRDNTNIDINGNNNGINYYIDNFYGEINKFNFNYNITPSNEITNKITIIIDDKDENEKISLIEKLKKIVKIFVGLSKIKYS